MRIPPLTVFAIVLLNLMGAVTSPLVVDQVGIIAAIVQVLIFGGLAVGLWALKRWARVLEIGFSLLQIIGLLAAIAFTLIASSMLEVPADLPRGEFVAVMVSLIFVNAVIIAVLLMPKTKALFR
jgi:hypothetical protein